MGVDLSVDECRATIASIVRFKFDDADGLSGVYFGSPFLAQAASKILAALIDAYDRAGDVRRAEGWRSWQEWSGRTGEHPVVVRRAAATVHWDDWSSDQQNDFLRCCAAPFALTEKDLEQLRAEVCAARL